MQPLIVLQHLLHILLKLNVVHKYIQQILESQGANDNLQQMCSIYASNLKEGSCPVKNVDEFESIVDSSNLISVCGKLISSMNVVSKVVRMPECQKLLKAYDLMEMDEVTLNTIST